MPKDGRETQWRQIAEHERPEMVTLPDNLDDRFVTLNHISFLAETNKCFPCCGVMAEAPGLAVTIEYMFLYGTDRFPLHYSFQKNSFWQQPTQNRLLIHLIIYQSH